MSNIFTVRSGLYAQDYLKKIFLKITSIAYNNSIGIAAEINSVITLIMTNAKKGEKSKPEIFGIM